MAAELTFSPGYVPGLTRTSRRPARKDGVHAARPGFDRSGEFAPPMTAEQRRALAALIHTPAGAQPTCDSRAIGPVPGSCGRWSPHARSRGR